ncbi:MAG: phage tail protein [Rhodobacteraceae bacterium GWE1_64_9]|nr:MAG: phage tail protein [Rhodobacteraceae bacterium GWE1_64_9]HBD89286.1 phage tail protein [Gemmobacter sp.]HBU15723.1 phage tail protein [Gemmobacter sp.]
MTWSNRHIGLPHQALGRDRAGCDCWGLACVVYQEELNISLPEYLGYASIDELGEIASLIEGATSSPLWLPITGTARAFDIAVFRRGQFSAHVGIVVRHGWMLHMADQRSSVIERYENGRWKHRFNGHFRHVELVSKGARA